MPGERAKKPATKKAGGDPDATGVAKNGDLNVKKPQKGKPIAAKILSWLDWQVLPICYHLASLAYLFSRER